MRKALIIGIDNYGGKNDLAGCVNDANDMAFLFARHGNDDANFAIKKHIDVKEKGILKGYINDCFAGKDDVALFYFSGHGYIDQHGCGYIITPDFKENDWGVSMYDILTIVNKSKCKNKIVILDCCHSGSMGTPPTADQKMTEIADGVTILTACEDEQVSLEYGGRGVFTALLSDALMGGASDITGHITPGGIYAYIDKALGAWEQRPVFKTNVTSFCSLRNVIPQVDIKILRKIVEYFPQYDSEKLLNPSYEFTNVEGGEHKSVQPYAREENIKIFKDLQSLESVGLVVPCGEEHMYFAAMNSKSCKLTTIGEHYWRLVKKNII